MFSWRQFNSHRVLYSNDGSVAGRDALASSVRRAERRAGLKVTGGLHILRHTFCSRLAMRGATAKAIQELAAGCWSRNPRSRGMTSRMAMLVGSPTRSTPRTSRVPRAA
ncbi:MAG: hypothetical protein E6J42_01755 [Chloroflexi bacterium]|nr:MAG: hypothetical protein E6J42_01755 [Chloroflexota bacterium]